MGFKTQTTAQKHLNIFMNDTLMLGEYRVQKSLVSENNVYISEMSFNYEKNHVFMDIEWQNTGQEE